MNLLIFGINICKSQNPKCTESNFNKMCGYFFKEEIIFQFKKKDNVK